MFCLLGALVEETYPELRVRHNHLGYAEVNQSLFRGGETRKVARDGVIHNLAHVEESHIHLLCLEGEGSD